MSQNKMAALSVGTLYREPLGEILFHYENGYKIEKGLRWGINSILESIWAYFCTHLNFSVCFPIRSHFASLQGIYYFLPLLSNGSMSNTLRKTLYFNTMYWSLFRPHTSAPVLLIRWRHFEYHPFDDNPNAHLHFMACSFCKYSKLKKHKKKWRTSRNGRCYHSMLRIWYAVFPHVQVPLQEIWFCSRSWSYERTLNHIVFVLK